MLEWLLRRAGWRGRSVTNLCSSLWRYSTCQRGGRYCELCDWHRANERRDGALAHVASLWDDMWAEQPAP